jgi:Chemoreceptor zinc-binding domain
MDTLDLLSAWSKHLEWMRKLTAFLDGGCEKWTTLTEAQATSQFECELGEWLYSYGLAKYAAFPAIRELERMHGELHSTIRRTLEFKKSGNVAAGKQECHKVKPLSDKLIALLNGLEKEVASKGRPESPGGGNPQRERC